MRSSFIALTKYFSLLGIGREVKMNIKPVVLNSPSVKRIGKRNERLN